MRRSWSLTFDLSPACSQMCSLITDDHLMPECCLSAASSSSIITPLPSPPPGIIVLLLIFFSSFICVFKHVRLSCGLIHPHVSQLNLCVPSHSHNQSPLNFTCPSSLLSSSSQLFFFLLCVIIHILTAFTAFLTPSRIWQKPNSSWAFSFFPR